MHRKIDEYTITGALNPCVQTKKVKHPCVKNSSCVGVRKNDGIEIIHNCQRKRACQDADVKPVIRGPMDDDRVLVESGAEMTLVPHEPSEFEKQKHNLTHIPLQPWCTSCVKGKAQAEPHKRTERITEDSELPVIQCDYLMLKDVAGTGGLKVLSMYVRTFGYGMSTVLETKGAADMFATRWAVKMLNFLGLSDIILQYDPEPSLIQVGRKCQIQTHRKNSHSKFSQPVTSKQWRSRKLSETVAGTGANNVGSNPRTHTIQTICRQRTDEMDCPTCSVAHSSLPR